MKRQDWTEALGRQEQKSSRKTLGSTSGVGGSYFKKSQIALPWQMSQCRERQAEGYSLIMGKERLPTEISHPPICFAVAPNMHLALPGTEAPCLRAREET